jgi:hypothetical protein
LALCQIATNKSVEVALEWILEHQLNANQDGHLVLIQDQISNPFGIVPDQHDAKSKKTMCRFFEQH